MDYYVPGPGFVRRISELIDDCPSCPDQCVYCQSSDSVDWNWQSVAEWNATHPDSECVVPS